MEALTEYLRLFTVSQMLLFLLASATSANALRVRCSLMGLSLGVIAYMILPLIYTNIGFSAQVVLWMLPEFVPLLLTVLAWQVFEDDQPLPLWLICLALIQVIVSVWACAERFSGQSMYVLDIARQLVKVVLVLMVLVVLMRGRDSDLVEQRLAIRGVLSVVIGLSALAVVLTELYFSFKVPQTVELFGMTAFFISALITNYILLRTNPDVRLIPVAQTPASIKSIERIDTGDAKLQRIIDHMAQREVYSRHNVKIADFAAELNLPEHKVRAKINKGLGFRNFNQFINSFRLEEAAKRLRDTPDVPILTIALDVGFASISVFNTSFSSVYGMTPSEYRRLG